VDVIYGADFKAAGFVFGAGLAGQKDDRDLRGRGIGLEAGTHLVAVHDRHHDVQKYQVRLFLSGSEG